MGIALKAPEIDPTLADRRSRMAGGQGEPFSRVLFLRYLVQALRVAVFSSVACDKWGCPKTPDNNLDLDSFVCEGNWGYNSLFRGQAVMKSGDGGFTHTPKSHRR